MTQHEDSTAEIGAAPDQRTTLPEAPGYRILSSLAVGGFGEVFLAEQLEPVKRRVALKFIKPGMDSRAIVARFEAERQALALMDHPCVAKVLDAGMTRQGRPYFAMEYVQGEPITRFCDRHQLPLRERLALFIKVCQAVQHAHQKGLIHRDIKPSNILVRYEGESPAPKVIDFGVAKALSQKLTESTVFTEQGQLIGTPEYMSPEQAEMSAVDIDTRTDIYSLGVLLYEILTGALPFESSSLRAVGFNEVQRIIREVEPPKPSTRLSALRKVSTDELTAAARARRLDDRALERSLRGDLDWIVLKCLEKERSRRYETANALAADLERYLRDEPITARPPSTTYKLRKFVRRNRTGVVAAALVFLAIAAGIAIAFASSVQANREAENARQAENRSRLLRHLVRGGQVSLAVLPLENQSTAPDQDYVVDGITSDLIADLSAIRALRLISDDSVMRYKGADMTLSDIADELRVDGIVTGSVTRNADDLRIRIELTHALSDEELFGATYEGSYKARHQIQSQIAIDIAERLGLSIAPDERARLATGASFDPHATELLARGEHMLRGGHTEELVLRALDLIDEAIRVESKYAEAYTARASAFFTLGNYYLAPHETMPHAKEAALKALEIDERNSEAHVMLGLVKFAYDYEYEDAAAEFRRALKLNPSSAVAHFAYGQYLAAEGRFDEGLERYERALAIDPMAFLDIQDWFYSVPFNSRDYDKAIEYAEIAVSVEPEGWWSAWAWMGLSYAMVGEYETALEKLQIARALSDDPMIFVFFGCTYADMGDTDRAEEMLVEILRQREYRYVCPFEIATVYVALGEYDIAFELLEEAVDNRSPCGPWFGTEPRLDPLRDDPRFLPLLERSGRIHDKSAAG